MKIVINVGFNTNGSTVGSSLLLCNHNDINMSNHQNIYGRLAGRPSGYTDHCGRWAVTRSTATTIGMLAFFSQTLVVLRYFQVSVTKVAQSKRMTTTAEHWSIPYAIVDRPVYATTYQRGRIFDRLCHCSAAAGRCTRGFRAASDSQFW